MMHRFRSHNFWHTLLLDDTKAITPAKKIVAFAAHHFAFGLAGLGLKFARWRLIHPSLPTTAKPNGVIITRKGAATRTRPFGG